MLQQLHIRNYVLIDSLEINFPDGLNVITGETGAGKSILMGALGLVLGERADTQVLLQPDLKCIVEALFDAPQLPELQAYFESNDLDWDAAIRIRREINPGGKSRGFVNDTPVNLTQLKWISERLVDLHQQFDTLELTKTDFQREALDAFCQHPRLLKEMASAFATYQSVLATWTARKEAFQKAMQERDYHQFLFDELEAFQPLPGELEQLDAELKLITHAAAVKQQLGAAYHQLQEGEAPLVQQLKSILQKLKAWHSIHPGIQQATDRLQAAQIELADIADELQRIDDQLDASAERQQWIENRISTGYALLKKHQFQSTEQLIGLKDALNNKLQELESLADDTQQLEQEKNHWLQQCEGLAQQIHLSRTGKIKPFSDAITGLLKQVGMPNARIQIELNDSGLAAHGKDQVRFLFDANKTNRFESLSKVASGGELSRIMLCIQSLVAGRLALPTLIFDEIDSGISGEAARQVGIIMQQLATAHQLIAITHQPQIAARASAHFYVYKEMRNKHVQTTIRQLANEERIEAIARMISGEKPTAAALANARELVMSDN
jgi:DNA repair protein RecN (Recombination protein N)